MDRKTLLREFAHIDVSLDTWPYCGGNTVAESLWQGVPVVTLLGSRFSARYGASLVTAAGCADMVGKSVEEYVEIAAALATNRDRLAFLRQNLRKMCKSHGLGDSRRFARVLEQAFSEMMGNYRRSVAGDANTLSLAN